MGVKGLILTCLSVWSSISLSRSRFTTPNVAGPFSTVEYLDEENSYNILDKSNKSRVTIYYIVVSTWRVPQELQIILKSNF